MNKKGDLKIQEMAFVLIALALLAGLVFVFVVKFQSVGIQSQVDELNQQRAISLRDKIAALPELKCAKINCIDRDKAESLQYYEVEDLFQGLKAARIVEIYPGDAEIILYQSNQAPGRSYSTFLNLCEQVKTGPTFDYECSLALLLVSI